MPRDPRRTRERIVSAAVREFAARGFAGARVDRIARLARANKRMLYHYFGNKEALFRSVLRLKLEERATWLAAAPDDPAESLPYWFGLACRDTDWIRLMEWEALGAGNGALIGEAKRRGAFERAVQSVRARQARGLLRRDLDPRHTLLSMMALTAFPLAFPQFTRLVTGHAPTDPAFQRARRVYLRHLAEAFRPR